MAEESKKPARVLTPFEVDLRDKTDKAWSVAVDAILAYARAHGDELHYQGWVLGRKTERETMQAAIAKAAKEGASGAEAPPAAPGPTLVRKAVALKAKPEFAASDVILAAIKVHPGLRGVELLEKIHETYPTLHERTFRTNLHRLKKADEIYVHNLRWFHRTLRPQRVLDLGENEGSEGPKENGGQ